MAPSKPKRICRFPHCNKKVTGTYCSQHKNENRSGWSKKKETHPWYNHKIWRGNINKPLGQRGGLREQKLLMTPFCERCKEKYGIVKDVTGKNQGAVDHIKPWRQAPEAEQWELFTDINNLQSLCMGCHAVKTGKGL